MDIFPKRAALIGALLYLLVTLQGCGGGGGGSSSGSVTSSQPTAAADTKLDWNQDNWDEKDWQ